MVEVGVDSGDTAGPQPLASMPPHLAEKILTSRSALAGERKQVTVLFADLKDSTALIRGLDPEAAQQLLDPAIQLGQVGRSTCATGPSLWLVHRGV